MLKNAEEKELSDADKNVMAKLAEYKEKYLAAMDDDLNTAGAIGVIFEIVYLANTDVTADSSKSVIEAVLDEIRELGGVLGLFTKTNEKSLDEKVEALIEERNAARKAKDWAKADAIRDKLKEMNIVLKDTPNGVQWSIAE